MPRIRRWHPVSHDFNRDPEIRELRRQFGDWLALVWVEMLAIADRNDGFIKGTPERLAESLAHISFNAYPKRAAKTCRRAFEFMEKSGWIVPQRAKDLSEIGQRLPKDSPKIDQRLPEDSPEIAGYLVANALKYHRRWDADKIPDGNQLLGSGYGSLNLKEDSTKNKSKREASSSSLILKSERVVGPSPEAVKIASTLCDLIARNFPNRTKQTDAELAEWAREADRIHRLDGHPWDEMFALLEWSQGDSFWRANILSMRKFRQQWTKLLAHRTRGETGRQAVFVYKPPREMPD